MNDCVWCCIGMCSAANCNGCSDEQSINSEEGTRINAKYQVLLGHTINKFNVGFAADNGFSYKDGDRCEV